MTRDEYNPATAPVRETNRPYIAGHYNWRCALAAIYGKGHNTPYTPAPVIRYAPSLRRLWSARRTGLDFGTLTLPSSRPLTAPLGLFRGVLLADAKHPLAHAKLRLSGCPWRIVSQACKTGPKTTLLIFNAHPAGRFRPCWLVWFDISTEHQPRRQGPMTVQHNNQHREPPR